MAFEVFKQIGARSKVYISISTNKTFGFPRTFLDKYGISSSHKVVILYDKSDEKIALHFTTDEVKHGLKVQIPNSQHGGVINARSFFDLKAIDSIKYAGRYDDYVQVPLSDIGISAAGTAFVLKLKQKQDKHQSVDDIMNG